MRKLFGFAGKMLFVDLSTGDIDSKPLSRQLVEKFIGGVGIGSWLVYNLTKRGSEPLSPDNPLVFSVSPLVGTLAPSASRVYVLSGSPESGLIGQANAGHSMGIMMKYAGYDVLVITGQSEKPVYLKISNNKVEILDASHLWGKDTWETTKLIQKELGEYWVDCIGPSGENLVKYSILLCSKRSSFNKAGTGTVMGSKKLKAIASRGTKGVKVANPEKFLQITNKITRRIVADPEINEWRAFGDVFASSKPVFPYEEFIDRIGKKPYACLGCPVACKHLIELNNGVYKGLSYRFSHLSANVNHSRLAAVENWDELVKSMKIMNKYGLQTSSASAMLKYLVECYEHGILKEKEIGFIPRLGGEGLREMIKEVTNKNGIGSLSLLEASLKVEGSAKYAQHVKGVGREHNLDRMLNFNAIETLTNPRGGKPELSQIPFGRGGLQDSFKTYEQFCVDLELQKEVSCRLCSGKQGFNFGRLVKWVEDYNMVYTSMGFCIRILVMRHIKLKKLSELYSATTGVTINPAQLLIAGERIFNVQKSFNVRAGATRLDDLPSRGLTWSPEKSLSMEGKEYGTLNQILNDYYDERGWNVETGIPTKKKLQGLGLQTIASDFGA